MLAWLILKFSKGVSWIPGNLSWHRTNINTVSLLPVCQMFMSSEWMCHVAFFCIFLYKAIWSTAHRYYPAGAGHSVALKKFTPSSCIQELMRKETYLLTMLYKTYVYNFNVAYRYKKIWTARYACKLIVRWYEHYCSCDGLLQWNLSWREPV